MILNASSWLARRARSLLAAAVVVYSPFGAVGQSQLAIPGATVAVQDNQALAGRIQRNAQRVDETQRLDDRVAQLLVSIPQPSANALDSARLKNQQLALARSQAEKAFSEFQKANPTNSNSVMDLQKQLEVAERERDQLVHQQTAELTPNSTNGGKGLRREVALHDLKPIMIMLVKNRVVPMMVPFFSIQRGRLKMALTGETVDGIVASRVHDGESIGNAVRPGGLLDAFLKKSNPATSYFKFVVCSDSVLAFHKAMEAVTSRGFAYAWDTGKDQDIMQALKQRLEPQDERGYLPEK